MRETQQITPHCHFGNKKIVIYLSIEARDGNLQNLDEIIGKAAKHIPFENKKHPDTPWKEMAGMCDKLIHHYFGVNLKVGRL